MAWTDKMVEDLRIMWKQGLTTGEIGKRLGVSKNSIVGKVHRLQLDARPSPIKKKNDKNDSPKTAAAEKKTKLETPKTDSKKTQKVEEKQSKPAKVVEKTFSSSTDKTPQPSKEISEKKEKLSPIPEHIFTPKINQPTKNYDGNAKLTDLDNHTCRWPLGDPKDDNFHFCGRKVKVGQTYCDEHSALAYVKPNNNNNKK